jgi:hypothetical protein
MLKSTVFWGAKSFNLSKFYRRFGEIALVPTSEPKNLPRKLSLKKGELDLSFFFSIGVTMQSTAVWNVTLCNLVEAYRCFGGTYFVFRTEE